MMTQKIQTVEGTVRTVGTLGDINRQSSLHVVINKPFNTGIMRNVPKFVGFVELNKILI